MRSISCKTGPGQQRQEVALGGQSAARPPAGARFRCPSSAEAQRQGMASANGMAHVVHLEFQRLGSVVASKGRIT